MNLWPYVCGFLAFPTIMGIYCLISSYIKMFERVRHLEFMRELKDKEINEMHDKVYFGIPEIMRKNGWNI